MKKRPQKITAAVLGMLLIAAALGGCSGSGNKEKSGPAAQESTAVSAAEDESAEEASEAEEQSEEENPQEAYAAKTTQATKREVSKPELKSRKQKAKLKLLHQAKNWSAE